MKRAKVVVTDSAWETFLSETTDRYARTGERWDLAKTLQAARQRGISVTWDDVRTNWELRHNGAMIPPAFITSFLGMSAATRKPETILDPWGVGALLIPVVTASNPTKATGMAPSSHEFAVATIMSGDAPITWEHARSDQPSTSKRRT